MININNDTIKNLIHLLFPENLIIAMSPSLLIPKSVEQISFLQKKRAFENNNINYNDNIRVQKNNNFIISNQDKIKIEEKPGNIRTNFDLPLQLIRPKLINYNNQNSNELYNLFNNNSYNYLNSMIKDIKVENYININTNINTTKYNINGNKFIDIQKNQFTNIKKIDENNENNNSTDSTNSQVPLNNTTLKQKNFFNIEHIKNVKVKKRTHKKNIKQTENNNEIKVLKNNKVVYVNNFLLNSYSTSKNIKKLNKIAFVGRNKRSSRYRGVSKNGNQWQVLMMINKNKCYIGSYPSEEFAARIYDVLALKNRGIKARTNFVYNSKQIKKICDTDIDIKSKNLHEIISQLVM